MVRIGILGVQGSVLEHLELLREINGVEPVVVKDARLLAGIDALIIPGGEPTAMSRLIEARGLREAVVERVRGGLPVLGVSAGAVLLASKVEDKGVGEADYPILKLMDIHVLRGVFGRQRDSFEAEVELEGLGRVRGAFIRAPVIKSSWGRARIIGYVEHPATGKAGVAALQDNMLAIAFHPEITGDKKVYMFLAEMAKGRM